MKNCIVHIAASRPANCEFVNNLHILRLDIDNDFPLEFKEIIL